MALEKANRQGKSGDRHGALRVLDCLAVLENIPDPAPPAPEPVSGVKYIDPLFKHLGQNGVDRVKEFRTYKDGWDSGKGAALNGKSEENLRSFLLSRSDEFPTPPSVFLTRAGNLRLSWENQAGDGIDLEFFPSGVEYFFESSGKEGFAKLNSVDKILAAGCV
jgi:hypothetical protein